MPAQLPSFKLQFVGCSISTLKVKICLIFVLNQKLYKTHNLFTTIVLHSVTLQWNDAFVDGCFGIVSWLFYSVLIYVFICQHFKNTYLFLEDNQFIVF